VALGKFGASAASALPALSAVTNRVRGLYCDNAEARVEALNAIRKIEAAEVEEGEFCRLKPHVEPSRIALSSKPATMGSTPHLHERSPVRCWVYVYTNYSYHHRSGSVAWRRRLLLDALKAGRCVL
jgi:hypothetical protein